MKQSLKRNGIESKIFDKPKNNESFAQLRKTAYEMRENWILASQNTNKQKEIALALERFGLKIALAPHEIDVDESAPDFRGNALLKALAYSEAFNRSALADDSGLCVDALNNAPGVHSARYAGICDKDRRDAANNAKLLNELRGLAPKSRGAKFVCSLVAVIVDPDIIERCHKLELAGVELDTDKNHAILSVEGYAYGRILDAPRGNNGFGYDPLFYDDKLQKSFAELSASEKLSVSHRGKAISEFSALLRKLMA
ncbi:MAG: non-canonical purine NTP pyrophosphatase [Bradymonadales bacterium]|jgi:XTP/dITP diphosphohydrolase